MKELIKEVNDLGYNINIDTPNNELAGLLPDNHYLCEKRIWSGNTYVDVDNGDYKTAILKMIIKTNY